MPIVSIDGNISASKSTLLGLLAATGIRTLSERLSKWRGKGGGPNLLEPFYGQPAHWAFKFQTVAFLTRA